MRTLRAVPFQGKGISSPPSASPGGCCADASSRGGEARSCFPTQEPSHWFCLQGERTLLFVTGSFGGRGSLCNSSVIRNRSSRQVKLNPCHVCCNRRLIINSGNFLKGWFRSVVSVANVCCSEGLVSCLPRGSKASPASPACEAEQVARHYFWLNLVTHLKEALSFCVLNGRVMSAVR